MQPQKIEIFIFYGQIATTFDNMSLKDLEFELRVLLKLLGNDQKNKRAQAYEFARTILYKMSKAGMQGTAIYVNMVENCMRISKDDYHMAREITNLLLNDLMWPVLTTKLQIEVCDLRSRLQTMCSNCH